MSNLNTQIKTWLAWGVITGSLIGALTPFGANASPASKPIKRTLVGQQTVRYQPSNASSKLGDFSSTGAPRSRGSAGSRGECLKPGQDANQPLPSPTALVPLAKGTLNEQAIDVPFGLTTRSHPTLWYQFPQSRDAIESIDLTIVDETTQELVQEVQNIPKQDSPHLDVWSVQWPETATALEVDRTYRWFLVVKCNNMAGAGVLLSGLIRREAVPEAIAQQLPQSSSQERASLYASNGVWHEAITELHQALDQAPNNSKLRVDWDSLMESVGLQVSSGAGS